MNSSGSVEQQSIEPAMTLEEWLNLPSASSQGATTAADVMECLDPTSSVFHEDYWMKETRRDGRLLSQVRPTKVVYGVVQKHSYGSAIVSHGGKIVGGSGASSGSTSQTGTTKVLAATTLQVGQPSPTAPDRGDIIVRVTINSRNTITTASHRTTGTGSGVGSDLKSFQQSPHADVLQSWLQRMMEEDFSSSRGSSTTAGMTNNNNNRKTSSIPSCLNLIPGKACLRLVVTVVVLEDGGCLKDTCLLACMAAWKDTKLPLLNQDLKNIDGKLYWKKANNSNNSTTTNDGTTTTSANDPQGGRSMMDTNSLRRTNFRISLTMGVWRHPTSRTTSFIVDPSTAEETCIGVNELVVTTEINGNNDDNDDNNLQIDYAGRIPLTPKDLAFVGRLAKARGTEISNILLY